MKIEPLAIPDDMDVDEPHFAVPQTPPTHDHLDEIQLETPHPPKTLLGAASIGDNGTARAITWEEPKKRKKSGRQAKERKGKGKEKEPNEKIGGGWEEFDDREGERNDEEEEEQEDPEEDEEGDEEDEISMKE